MSCMRRYRIFNFVIHREAGVGMDYPCCLP